MGKLVEYVDSGKSWFEAYKLTYPEIKEKDAIVNRANTLRYRNKSFKEFLQNRASKLGETSKLPKKELLNNWISIAQFNVAELYDIDADGSVFLKEGWLEFAKKHNVIKRIVVTKKKRVDKDGNETITETTDIIPYSRDFALVRLGKLLGYDTSEKTPGNQQNVQNNNLILVGQIDKIMKAAKLKQLPVNGVRPDVPVVDAEFVEKMVGARIVKPEEAT